MQTATADMIECAELLRRPAVSEQPIVGSDAVPRSGLDYSVESLRLLDTYLERLHGYMTVSEGKSAPSLLQRLLGRKAEAFHAADVWSRTATWCGAYVGEVIRRNVLPGYAWYSFREWIGTFPQHMELLGQDQTSATSFVLGVEQGAFLLPLGKAWKCILNGPGDSTYYLAAMAAKQAEG